MVERIKDSITIPEYLYKYVGVLENLNGTRKICCPFHNERSPSFVINPVKRRWNCFGACHKGGDVIDLHRFNRKIASRDEAIEDLARILGIKNYRGTFGTKSKVDFDYVNKIAEKTNTLIKATSTEEYKKLDFQSVVPNG